MLVCTEYMRFSSEDLFLEKRRSENLPIFVLSGTAPKTYFIFRDCFFTLNFTYQQKVCMCLAVVHISGCATNLKISRLCSYQGFHMEI